MAEWRYGSTILNCGTWWRQGQIHVPFVLTPRKQLGGRVYWPRIRSGRHGNVKSILSDTTIESWFLCCPARSLDWATCPESDVHNIYRESEEERSIFWEVTVSAILSKKCICTCVLFRDRAISLYSSKVADNKEILRPVSDTGIYCSSDEVGTVYLV
jgi:hypothetical protein